MSNQTDTPLIRKRAADEARQAERDQLKEARERVAELEDRISRFFAGLGCDHQTERFLKGGDVPDGSTTNPSTVASTGASEVPSSLSAERVDNFKECPRTTKVMRLGSACKTHHWYTAADFSDTLERELTTALAQIEKLRGALNYARPYVKNASVRMYDGTNGVHIRKEAKARLAAIDAALAQEPVAP